jgi:hypothetical protein
MAQLLGPQLGSLQIAEKIREHTAPLVWAEVVGPQVANATEVLGVRDGVLRVSTKSSVWSHELTFYKSDILQRLNTRLGARPGAPSITDILFQNHGLQNRRDREAAREEVVPLTPTADELDDVALSPSELALIERGIQAVTDEGLRDRLRRVRMADLKLRTWRLDNGWLVCAVCGDIVPRAPTPARTPASRGGAGAADFSGASPCPRCRIGKAISPGGAVDQAAPPRP